MNSSCTNSSSPNNNNNTTTNNNLSTNTNTTTTKQLQLPSTSSQPLSDMATHIQESFSAFMLNGDYSSDEDNNILGFGNSSPTTPTQYDNSLGFGEDDDGYTTPTNNDELPNRVPESRWVFSTPVKAVSERVCPGAPKRKPMNHIVDITNLPNTQFIYSQSLPNDSSLGPRGITKPKKYRKVSPSVRTSNRRRSFPNIRLDFGDMETSNDQGQMSNF